MLTLSLVICTKDRPKQLRRCLKTILEQSFPPDEIVIVDASSDDSAWKVVDSLIARGSKPAFRYVHTHPHTAYQRNVGFGIAQGDIVGSVDDDTELDPDVLRIIKETFADPRNKEVGGVMPCIVDPEGKWRGRWSPSIIFKRIFLLTHHVASRTYILPSGFPVFPYRRDNITRAQEAEVLNGLYFYRKEVAKSFRFHEGFTGYSFMEDVELAYRVSQSYRLLYLPTARVLHLHVNTNRVDKYTLYKQIVENHHYFFCKAVKQNFLNRLAFYWSNLGVFITVIPKRPLGGRKGALSGFLAGFRCVLKRQRKALYNSIILLKKPGSNLNARL